MRRVTSISLLILLLFNLFGFYISFFVSLDNIKTEVAKSISISHSNTLEHFQFTAQEYRQLIRPDGDDEELIINDFMYDVKAVEYKNNKVIVFAKRDTSETNLIKKFLSEINSQSSSSQTDNSNLLIKVLQQEFVGIEADFDFILTTTSQRISSKAYSIISRSLNQATPPPDIA